MTKLLNQIEKEFAALNLNFSSEVLKQYEKLIEALKTWNQFHNLTTVKTDEQIIHKHLIDSLSILPYLQGETCLDVGSGAGFPALPLAIVEPNRQWCLIDSNHKKIAFINYVKATLSLSNVTAIHARIENYVHDPFDLITCRAFSSLKDFYDKTQHLANEKTLWLAMKGEVAEQELNELNSCSLNLTIHPLQTHIASMQTRNIVVIRTSSKKNRNRVI